MKPIAAFFFLSSALWAAEFTSLPAATDLGDSVRVTFAVSAFTDATVEVLDSLGRVVRSLGSGVLGARAPEPFAANTLSQTVYWDKTDDNGAAFTGSYSVRVGLDLKARFDGMFGWDSTWTLQYSGINAINGMAMDSSGRFVVRTGSGNSGSRGVSEMFLLDNTGRYIRTLQPYPGHLPEERLKGYGRATIDGKPMPIVYNSFHGMVCPEFQSYSAQNLSVTRRGWIVCANTSQGFYGNDGPVRRLLIFAPDGSCPRDSLYGPSIPAGSAGALWTALSPDDRLVYAAGVHKGGYTESARMEVVYRGVLDSGDPMDVFFGVKETPGSDNLHLNGPAGLAVDASGNVYIADRNNNRVVVTDSNGTFLTAVPVDSPFYLAIDRENGKLYVGATPSLTLIRLMKFNCYPALDSVCAIPVSRHQYAYTPLMLLDVSRARPVIWFSGTQYGATEILAWEDMGGSFSARSDLAFNKAPASNTVKVPSDNFEAPGYLAVSPDGKTAYMGCNKWVRLNLETGALSKSPITANELNYGPDGSLYAFGSGGWQDSLFRRFDASGTQVPFPGGAMSFNTTFNTFQGPVVGSRGFNVTPSGDIYVVTALRGVHASVDHYGPNGALVQKDVVTMMDSTRAIGSGLEMDRKGNFYVGYNVRPFGYKYPASITGAYFPEPIPGYPGFSRNDYTQPWLHTFLNHYLHNIGSLLRFPASGGRIDFAPGSLSGLAETSCEDSVPSIQVNGLYKRIFRVTGAESQIFGLSPSPGWNIYGDPGCNCYTARFAVDKHDRIIYPEAMRFSVRMVDANRNEILRFGEYGNIDQRGPGGSVPSPEIPFAWPMFVRQANGKLYVSDIANHRIVRVRLDYSSWATSTGESGLEKARAVLPVSLSAYPMPFNPSVTLRLFLPAGQKTVVRIRDASGRLVKALDLGFTLPGEKLLSWDGRDGNGKAVGAGTYLACVSAGNRTFTARLALVR